MEFSTKDGSIFLLKCRGTTASDRRFLPKVIEKIINVIINNNLNFRIKDKMIKRGNNMQNVGLSLKIIPLIKKS